MKPRFYWLVVVLTDTVGVHTSLELVSCKVFADMDMDGSVQMARYLPKEISAKDGEFECEPRRTRTSNWLIKSQPREKLLVAY